MATCTSHNRVRRPFLGRAKLDEYWNMIKSRVRCNDEQEILYFYHCTCIKARRGILSDGAILGSSTDTPSYAPLAGKEDVTGTWFSMSKEHIQQKSPYGSQKMLFYASDMMSYLKKNVQQEGNDENCTETEAGENSSEAMEEPKLFFECVHHYGNTQYVRLLLVRASDPMVTWCRDTCKEIDLRNNPLLEYRNGRLWSRRHGRWSKFIVDVLVVGDIYLNQMPRAPEWSKVGTMTRAGADPVQGLC